MRAAIDSNSLNNYGKTKRQRLDILRGELAYDRSRFESRWQELGTYVSPNRYRRGLEDNETGSKIDYSKIIDPVATRAVRTAMAGMVSGGTNPASEWFRLTTPDPGLMKFKPVKTWLYDLTSRMNNVFLKSNIYQVLPLNYADAFTFGTACMLLEQHETRVIHAFSFPCGSYWLGRDREGRINVFMREFQMTVWQLVNTFGDYDPVTGRAMWERFSHTVKNLWDNSQYQQRIDVRHCIYPNFQHDPNSLEPKHKAFASDYMEIGNATKAGKYKVDSSNNDRFLRESGYDHFPVLAPRWQVVGEDVYGTDQPAEVALGDIKQLQTMIKNKARGVELKMKPPLVADERLKTSSVGVIPGHITWITEADGVPKVRSAYDVNFDLSHITMDIQDIRSSIKITMLEDLFRFMESLRASGRTQITAREIDQHSAEQLSILGPFLHQLDQDQNRPMIEDAFRNMAELGLLPPDPPPELQGVDLKIEYISILHQAQKALRMSGLERYLSFTQSLVQVWPDARHKVDTDEALEHYADMTGVPPKIVRSEDEVEAIRQAEAEMMAKQQQIANMQGEAQVMKDLGAANTQPDSALGQMVDQARAGQVIPQGV